MKLASTAWGMLVLGCALAGSPACKSSGDDGAAGSGAGANAGDCGPLVGSCDRLDGTGCADTYGSGVDPSQAEATCEAAGQAAWSSSQCDTAGSVGGCRMTQAGGTCVTTWFWAPVTAAELPLVCQHGTIVSP